MEAGSLPAYDGLLPGLLPVLSSQDTFPCPGAATGYVQTIAAHPYPGTQSGPAFGRGFQRVSNYSRAANPASRPPPRLHTVVSLYSDHRPSIQVGPLHFQITHPVCFFLRASLLFLLLFLLLFSSYLSSLLTSLLYDLLYPIPHRSARY